MRLANELCSNSVILSPADLRLQASSAAGEPDGDVAFTRVERSDCQSAAQIRHSLALECVGFLSPGALLQRQNSGCKLFRILLATLVSNVNSSFTMLSRLCGYVWVTRLTFYHGTKTILGAILCYYAFFSNSLCFFCCLLLGHSSSVLRRSGFWDAWYRGKARHSFCCVQS